MNGSAPSTENQPAAQVTKRPLAFERPEVQRPVKQERIDRPPLSRDLEHAIAIAVDTAILSAVIDLKSRISDRLERRLKAT